MKSDERPRQAVAPAHLVHGRGRGREERLGDSRVDHGDAFGGNAERAHGVVAGAGGDGDDAIGAAQEAGEGAVGAQVGRADATPA